MFSISFIEKPDGERFIFDRETEIIGRICLGEFEEHFSANTTFWGADEYRAQWRHGLLQICEGAEQSCLLTSVTRPDQANFFDTWAIYRHGHQAIFQNRLLLFAEMPEPALFGRIYDTILPYQAVNEDDEPISEWRVPLLDLTNFIASGVG